MKRLRYARLPIATLSSLLIGILVIFVAVTTVRAQDDMCIPSIGGLGGLPVIDGIVENFDPGAQFDPGWNGATRFNLSADLGTTKSAIFQVGRTDSSVYISLVVDTPEPGSDNTIVLVLSTDGNPANDWRIHIQPFDVGMTDGSDQVPLSVTYWRNSDNATTGWNTANATGTTASPGFWLKDQTRFSKSGSRWAIEIQIPWESNPANAHLDNKIYFPNSGTFKLYFNVLSTSVVSGSFYQDPWPPGHLISAGTSLFLTRNTPPESQWGVASFNNRSECTGVSLTRSNIGVLDPTNPSIITNEIRRYNPSGGFTETLAQCEALSDGNLWPGTKGPLNTFVAKPFSNMPAGTNAQVSAKFFIANWGIPSATEWRPIGEFAGSVIPPTVTNNPTSELSISPGSFGTLNSTTWELSYKQSCVYSKSKRSDLSDSYIGHQCIQVELDSTDPNTRFLNKSVQRNMDFVQASAFSRDAEISAIGYGNPPAGRTAHEFLLSVNTKVQRYERDGGYYVPVGFKMPLITWQGKLASDTTRKKGERAVPDWSRISWDKIPIPFPYFDIKISEAMTWITRGYRKTGQYLVINGQKYEYAEYVGGFGYVVAHEGSVAKWTEKLVGENGELKPTKQKGLYSIEIPPGEVRRVATKVKAVEPTGIRKCFDWLR